MSRKCPYGSSRPECQEKKRGRQRGGEGGLRSIAFSGSTPSSSKSQVGKKKKRGERIERKRGEVLVAILDQFLAYIICDFSR